ncbi:cyclic nucleotide-gated channel alpha-3-like [Watersipora subatra]|uniref:cyclic nucleotide-gated channel alpha-3-like n=1 Tax=Watersipora subatra TaxID=2589382 RepID=UPI00355C3C79
MIFSVFNIRCTNFLFYRKSVAANGKHPLQRQCTDLNSFRFSSRSPSVETVQDDVNKPRIQEIRSATHQPAITMTEVKSTIMKVQPATDQSLSIVDECEEVATRDGSCSIFKKWVRHRMQRIAEPWLQCVSSKTSISELDGEVKRKTLSQRFAQWSVVLPVSRQYYAWLVVVSIAILYNLVILIARIFFDQLQAHYQDVWLAIDYICDTIFLLDTLIRFRTAFLENGLPVRNSKKLARKYIKSVDFKLDVLSLLPTDFFYLIKLVSVKYNPAFRLNRLLRFRRLPEFFDKTIRNSSYPNVFRIVNLLFYILVIVHWNACFYFALSDIIGFGEDGWVYPNTTLPGMDTLSRKYIYSFYWSTLTLLTIGETPHPEIDIEYVFVVIDFLVGVLIFATIVGNVGSMITNMNRHSSLFTQRLDGIKRYMKIQKVSQSLEKKVINWFDYLWTNRETFDDDDCLLALPEQLRSEIALDVHMEALRQAKVFQDCAAEGEEGLLRELVLKLKSQVFNPGDYICLRGDVGREMYIVKEGKLKVLGPAKEVYATLEKGSVFGEISILEIPGSKIGNRRMADVMSVGYSSCLILSKSDLWGLLKDYPKAREKLYEKGRDLLALDDMLSNTEPSTTEYRETSMYEAAEMLRGMEEQIETLELKVDQFLSSYNKEREELKAKVDRLERLFDSRAPPCWHVEGNRSPAASQSQIHTSISVTHLKSPNSCHHCSSATSSACKTTQLSLNVENLEYEHHEDTPHGLHPVHSNSSFINQQTATPVRSQTLRSTVLPEGSDKTSVALSSSSRSNHPQ